LPPLIYIERCIDEELGYGALEAMAMGVPVAKLTHPIYERNVDYDYAIINSTSIYELAKRISQAIENEDLDKYSQNTMDYIRRKRVWNSVKHNFINMIRNTLF